MRVFKMSLGRVYDNVRISEGGESLSLAVDADPMRMVAGLNQAQKRLQAITGESTEAQVREAALSFAGVIFGPEQAERLLEFYHGDPGCVINICGRYFSERLRGKIAKAQKRK